MRNVPVMYVSLFICVSSYGCLSDCRSLRRLPVKVCQLQAHLKAQFSCRVVPLLVAAERVPVFAAVALARHGEFADPVGEHVVCVLATPEWFEEVPLDVRQPARAVAPAPLLHEVVEHVARKTLNHRVCEHRQIS